MIFAKQTTSKKLVAVAAELRSRADKLTAKRATAQAEFERAEAAREEFSTAGDIDDSATAARLQAMSRQER